jgi:hypothetical protein
MVYCRGSQPFTDGVPLNDQKDFCVPPNLQLFLVYLYIYNFLNNFTYYWYSAKLWSLIFTFYCIKNEDIFWIFFIKYCFYWKVLLWNVSAYHLTHVRVPPVVRVPQVGNPWPRQHVKIGFLWWNYSPNLYSPWINHKNIV